jgi:UDP-GlcNAc:undecaprenyl-phosphate GlcNAc-1-phosphate transferase
MAQMIARTLFVGTMFFGLLWGIAFTPMTIRLAVRYRILDRPNERKAHPESIPRGGGLALWSGLMLWNLLAWENAAMSVSLATGASLIFFVGYVDDMHPLPPLFRLALHLTAAFFVLLPLPLSYGMRLLLLLWIAGCTSAFNLIDGMNGLCLTLSMSSFAIGAAAGFGNFWGLLLGISAGILFWNFPKAKTFLGDGGSTLLGFLWSALLVEEMGGMLQRMPFHMVLLLLLLLGGVPILDTSCSIVRRLLCGRSPFSPDRGHLHHRLLDAGLHGWGVLAILNLLHIAFVASGIYLLGGGPVS